MELPEFGGGDDGDDAAERVSAAAFFDEGEGFLEIFGDLGGDAADGADVEGGAGGGGGGEADGGAEHLAEAVDLLADLGALEFEDFGFLDGAADLIG